MPTQPAVLGTARLANFRLAYEPAALVPIRISKIWIQIGGVDARVRVSGLTIHDILNDVPNACTLTVDDQTPPTVEQTLKITINADAPQLLFLGTLQSVGLSYEGRPGQRVWPCTAIDTTVLATRRRPFGTWVNVSATTIAQTIVAQFAPSFSTTHLAAGLPAVSITFDGSEDWVTAMARLADMIGGYCKVDALDAYLFLTDTSNPPDAIDDTPGRFLNDPPITMTSEVSQLRTRIYGKGHGEVLLSDVAAGETILPIADAVMFNPAGSQAIVGTTPDGAQSQIIRYTGVFLGGGAGTPVGPGASPAVAPTLTLAAGAGLGTGFYGYGYTDTTPAGESFVSPIATIQTGVAVANPVGAPTLQNSTNHSYGAPWHIGDQLYIVVAYLNGFGVTLASTASNTVTAAQSFGTVPLDLDAPSLPVSPDPSVVTKKIYVNINGAWTMAGTLPNSTPSRFNLAQNGVITAGPPATVTPSGTNTTAGSQVGIAGIAVGATPTTGRKVYRTTAQTTAAAALTAPLKLQQTIANNTATVGVQDATPDGSLGAAPPISDTSGISFSGGQILAGSTSILTAGTGPLPASGWVITLARDLVRYTGISGNTLTGIPASGIGAILTTIYYGDPLVPAPALTGVTGLALAALAGTPVCIWVQRDDLAAQATQAAIDVANGVTPADGVYEGPLIIDERRGEASLIALCDATLKKYSTPIITVVHATRDPKAVSGKIQHYDLTTPRIGPFDLVIQDVTITEIGVAVGVLPKRLVTASSDRFSLNDLLRQLAATP